MIRKVSQVLLSSCMMCICKRLYHSSKVLDTASLGRGSLLEVGAFRLLTVAVLVQPQAANRSQCDGKDQKDDQNEDQDSNAAT